MKIKFFPIWEAVSAFFIVLIEIIKYALPKLLFMSVILAPPILGFIYVGYFLGTVLGICISLLLFKAIFLIIEKKMKNKTVT